MASEFFIHFKHISWLGQASGVGFYGHALMGFYFVTVFFFFNSKFEEIVPQHIESSAWELCLVPPLPPPHPKHSVQKLLPLPTAETVTGRNSSCIK